MNSPFLLPCSILNSQIHQLILHLLIFLTPIPTVPPTSASLQSVCSNSSHFLTSSVDTMELPHSESDLPVSNPISLDHPVSTDQLPLQVSTWFCHLMQIISKLGIFNPKELLTTSEPHATEDALQQENWKATMTNEILALMTKGTWSLVPLHARGTTIGYKWIFKVKQNPDGIIKKIQNTSCLKRISSISWF